MLFARHERELREGYGESTLFAPPRTGEDRPASDCAATRIRRIRMLPPRDNSKCSFSFSPSILSPIYPYISALKDGDGDDEDGDGDDDDGGGSGDSDGSYDDDNSRTSRRARRWKKGRQGAQRVSAPGY